MIEFSNKDGALKYVYDYDNLELIQTELANAAIMFRAEQLQNRPSSFQVVEASGGAEINIKACAFLLREIADNGDVRPFDRARVKFAVQFLSSGNLKGAAERGKVKEVITDFLEKEDRGVLALILYSPESLLMAKMMAQVAPGGQGVEAPSSEIASDEIDSTVMESSTEG